VQHDQQGSDLASIVRGLLPAAAERCCCEAQEPRLFGMSIADNIAYGCPRPVTREDVVAAAQEANAEGFIAALPNGYDTMVTDR
jgi:ATP-binding cassette, subfamily B, bacterial